MLPRLLHRLHGLADVLVDAVQQAALLDHQSLQVLINLVQTVYRFQDLGDLLVSLLQHPLLHVLELLLRQPVFGLAVALACRSERGAVGAPAELLLAVVLGLLLGSQLPGLLADVQGQRHEHAREI